MTTYVAPCGRIFHRAAQGTGTVQIDVYGIRYEAGCTCCNHVKMGSMTGTHSVAYWCLCGKKAPSGDRTAEKGEEAVAKFNRENIKKSAERAARAVDTLKLVPRLDYVRSELLDFHPHNRFAEGDNAQDIQDLAADIELNGMFHTIVVNKRGERYRILSGEKRFRAAQLLHKDTVPCNVYDNLDDAAETRILYAANLQVRSYSPAKILQFYRELSELLQKQSEEGTYSGSITAGIAKIMRISERQVRKYARICEELNEFQIEELETNRISINDANRIAMEKAKGPEKTEPVPSGENVPEKTEPVPSVQGVPGKTEPVPSGEGAPEKTEPVPSGEGAPEKTEPVPSGEGAPEKTEPVPSIEILYKNTAAMLQMLLNRLSTTDVDTYEALRQLYSRVSYYMEKAGFHR